MRGTLALNPTCSPAAHRPRSRTLARTHAAAAALLARFLRRRHCCCHAEEVMAAPDPAQRATILVLTVQAMGPEAGAGRRTVPARGGWPTAQRQDAAHDLAQDSKGLLEELRERAAPGRLTLLEIQGRHTCGPCASRGSRAAAIQWWRRGPRRLLLRGPIAARRGRGCRVGCAGGSCRALLRAVWPALLASLLQLLGLLAVHRFFIANAAAAVREDQAAAGARCTGGEAREGLRPGHIAEAAEGLQVRCQGRHHRDKRGVARVSPEVTAGAKTGPWSRTKLA
mmetsp:Transcript_54008/g.149762  ORF Transcript_54008/g.149762 Transcript_54008/m.149762 type:complete len:282 (-) Transcript_54008:2-847(-)